MDKILGLNRYRYLGQRIINILMQFLIVILLQALVTATGSTDSFVEDSSRSSPSESRGAEADNDALSVPDNDILDASIVSDDEEFAEGYVLNLSEFYLLI